MAFDILICLFWSVEMPDFESAERSGQIKSGLVNRGPTSPELVLKSGHNISVLDINTFLKIRELYKIFAVIYDTFVKDIEDIDWFNWFPQRTYTQHSNGLFFCMITKE